MILWHKINGEWGSCLLTSAVLLCALRYAIPLKYSHRTCLLSPPHLRIRHMTLTLCLLGHWIGIFNSFKICIPLILVKWSPIHKKIEEKYLEIQKVKKIFKKKKDVWHWEVRWKGWRVLLNMRRGASSTKLWNSGEWWELPCKILVRNYKIGFSYREKI